MDDKESRKSTAENGWQNEIGLCSGKDFPVGYDTIFSDAISDITDLQLSLTFSRIKCYKNQNYSSFLGLKKIKYMWGGASLHSTIAL